MDMTEYLRRVPKVELHCHVEGTLRPATVADLAAKHGIELPTDDIDTIYDYDTIYEFLETFRFVNSTVIDREDFARVAFETLEDGVRSGNLKYREMFFNPTLHTTRGVPLQTAVDGFIDGIRRAEAELGVGCRLIADVYRQDSAEDTMAWLEELIALDRPEVIGLGMDAAEAPDPPEKFAAVFQRAGEAGLRRTSHACEDGPPVNITTCLDDLGCERLDHGYHILDDPDVVARCREAGIVFTVCPTSTARVYGWPDLLTHPINGMIEAGLKVMLNSDDPTMFHTDIGQEYVEFCGQNGHSVALVRELVLNGVDGTWLPDEEKAAMRARFVEELDALEAELGMPA